MEISIQYRYIFTRHIILYERKGYKGVSLLDWIFGWSPVGSIYYRTIIKICLYSIIGILNKPKSMQYNLEEYLSSWKYASLYEYLFSFQNCRIHYIILLFFSRILHFINRRTCFAFRYILIFFFPIQTNLHVLKIRCLSLKCYVLEIVKCV